MLSLLRDESRQKWLSNLRHELRSPLNGLIAVLPLVFEEHQSDDQIEYEKLMHRCGDRMLVLINIVVDYLDIATGGSVTTRKSTTIDLRKCLQSVITIHKPTAEAKGVHITECIVPPSGLLYGDEDRVQAILYTVLNDIVSALTAGDQVTLDIKRNGTPSQTSFCLVFRYKDTLSLSSLASEGRESDFMHVVARHTLQQMNGQVQSTAGEMRITFLFGRSRSDS